MAKLRYNIEKLSQLMQNFTDFLLVESAITQ